LSAGALSFLVALSELLFSDSIAFFRDSDG
jgi:hypothetical protein